MANINSPSTSRAAPGSTGDVESGAVSPPTQGPEASANTNDTREDKSETSTETDHTSSSRYSIRNRKLVFSALILIVGACASAAFLAIGILNAQETQANEFEKLTEEFVIKLQGAFKDYELFGLWIHESCRERGTEGNLLGICDRQDFHELYEYLRSSGVDFQSAQFMPFVPHDKREEVEQEAREFYEERYPHVNYRGIVGLFINDDGVKVLPQEEKEFYWPVHYIEPVLGNEAAIDLDLYSSPTQQKTIQHAVTNWLPSVTDRIKLVQETDPGAYSIILHHPGIRLSDSNETDTPKGIALLVIRIPALLAHAGHDAKDSASFYLYDATLQADEPVFLGAHTVYAQPDNAVTFVGLPEVPLTELEDSVETRLETREVAIADRTWIIAVVSLPNTYEAQTVFVVLGGITIFMASLLLGACFWTQMTRDIKMNAIKAQAAQEKAGIIVKTAREQALAERQLNEYIAHEVRNPLSSAIAALSFVSSAAKQPILTDENKQIMKDDLKIVDSSLQFIDELLRNMLDMNRAADQQMKISFAPTDVLRDVLEPVASILHMRGNKIDIIIECEPSIVVLSDRLRLKQIVLNLSTNAVKFVQKGFIKLKCMVVQKHNGQQSVQLQLEDSGPGIPMEKRNNLFAKFQDSLDLLNQGTGIGLSLCKHLCELLNGDLWLDEDFDSGVEDCPGTRFILDLHTPPLGDDYWDENDSLLNYDKAYPLGPGAPASEFSSAQEEPRGASSTSGGKTTIGTDHMAAESKQIYHGHHLPEKLKILFVDDDMVLRKLFKRSVQRVAPGWDVQEAANGETAVHIAEQDPSAFHVIFLDQYMSSIEKQMLGTETARTLRAKGVTSLICGLSANDAEEQFLEAGADNFLFKPFPCEKDSLRRALLNVLFQPSRRNQINISSDGMEIPRMRVSVTA